MCYLVSNTAISNVNFIPKHIYYLKDWFLGFYIFIKKYQFVELLHSLTTQNPMLLFRLKFILWVSIFVINHVPYFWSFFNLYLVANDFPINHFLVRL